MSLVVRGTQELVKALETTAARMEAFEQIGKVGEFARDLVERNARRAFASQTDPVTGKAWQRRAVDRRRKRRRVGATKPLLQRTGAMHDISVRMAVKRWSKGKRVARILPYFGLPAGTVYPWAQNFGARGKGVVAGKRGHRVLGGSRRSGGQVLGGVWKLPRRRVFGLSRADVRAIGSYAQSVRWV